MRLDILLKIPIFVYNLKNVCIISDKFIIKRINYSSKYIIAQSVGCYRADMDIRNRLSFSLSFKRCVADAFVLIKDNFKV